MKKFAIILSGCGRADGSEIHESVTAMLAISDLGGTYDCYAPNIEQAAVINGLTSEEVQKRIAEGKTNTSNTDNLKSNSKRKLSLPMYPFRA